MVCIKGTFKEQAVITLKTKDDSKFGFTFGASKAKLIIDNLDAVKELAATWKAQTKQD